MGGRQSDVIAQYGEINNIHLRNEVITDNISIHSIQTFFTYTRQLGVMKDDEKIN